MGKLLVIADLDDKCVATARGLELAHKLGHRVDVVAFTYASLRRLTGDRAEQEMLKRQLLDRRELALRERIDRYARPGQDVSLRVIWMKDIHDWIRKRCASGSYELVVKTVNRSGTFTYTSTDWHLLRECPAPVLIASEKQWSRTKPVLAALDLGSRSRVKQALNAAVLARAQAYAGALGVELRIIGAIELPTLLADLTIVDADGYAKEQREAMQPRIDRLAAQYGLAERTFRTKRGPVAKVITAEAARSGAQLVVMGTVGRSGVKARLLGNTAEAVLQTLNTDVLALKPGC
ncbi:universal stress protein [Pseudohaliea rubra]|uniref:Universal stress protein E n=1 Tax=Pseudohaliea rubra DSM 19751 TaxID=1265313 RepID=A0A095VNC7_9GAMM|nr:universal stress protein [Pseudohaliea rubra]KGE02895.1 Universal stress protein E [Pseudohaliea rubra DSM 19751]